MRRILAISMVAAIPAVLPLHAAGAKPAPPAADAHARQHPGHGVHGKPAHRPNNDPRDAHGRAANGPGNDVKVSMDGDEAADQGKQGEQGQAGQTGHAGHAKRAEHAPRARTNKTLPSSGADTGFSIPAGLDSDDPALPPEAAAALQEVGIQPGGAPAQNTGQSVGRPTGQQAGTPATRQPIRQPAGQAAGRPASRPVGRPGTKAAGRSSEDKNTNLTSNPSVNRMAGSASGPSHLVLHMTSGPAAGRTVTLKCDPPGGTHPRALQACADVAKSKGDLQQMPAADSPRACFMIYAPVTVTAQGQWHGSSVRYTKRFPNTCVMRDKTGSLFDF